jgi:hypothetical protein
MHSESPFPLRHLNVASWTVSVRKSPGGAFYLRPDLALGSYPRTLTECLEGRVQAAPDRTFLAERAGNDGWRSLTYAEFRTRAVFEALLRDFARRSTGSSNRIARAIVLRDAPPPDAGEVTDKGSIHQAAVLKRCAHLGEQLYTTPYAPEVIVADT